MTTLTQLIHAGGSGRAIEAHLDALSHPERMRQVHELGRNDQVKLYDRADPQIDREHFVPKGAVLKPIKHHGRNNQPAFRTFQKPMTLGEDGTIFGFNEGILRPVIGPGYFVLRDTNGDDRGHMVVDYFMIPSGTTPSGWPAIKRNEDGPQQFVYGRCRDYMRRVSAHVSVGKAYREESRVMGYFVLVRED